MCALHPVAVTGTEDADGQRISRDFRDALLTHAEQRTAITRWIERPGGSNPG